MCLERGTCAPGCGALEHDESPVNGNTQYFCTSYDNIFKRVQDATEERLALTDTIKILNDKAALKFFKILHVPVHVRWSPMPLFGVGLVLP